MNNLNLHIDSVNDGELNPQEKIEQLVFSYLLKIQPLKQADPELHDLRLKQLQQALTLETKI
jgi:hypothetical protein